MNKFFRIRAIIAIICIIIALCVFSVGSAIKITLTMLEKKDNILSIGNNASHMVSNNPGKSAEIFNFSKAKKLPFYYNGALTDNIFCYEGEKGETLFPLDILLQKFNIGYSFLNADDIVKFDYAGKSVVIRLNSLNISWGYENVVLDAASASYDNHIYVSAKILNMFKGNIYDMVLLEDTFYLNCWPSGLNKDYKEYKLLKLSDGRLEAYAIPGTNARPEKIKTPLFDQIYPVKDTKNYLLRSGSKYYLLDSSLKTQLLPSGAGAMLSEGGGQIYWLDKAQKRLYIYGIKNGVTKSYKNYMSRIAKNKNVSGKYDKLFDYKYGGRYSRLDFTTGTPDDIYTIIERNGKVVVEEKSHYCPDGSKLLYFVHGKGYYTANSDGTGISFAGTGVNAYWVDNDRVIVDMGNSFFVYDTRYKSIIPVDIVRVFAGTAMNGEIFSVRDGILYSGPGMDARQLFRLPWSCDYIYANDGNGPYLILSSSNGKVFCLSGKASFIAADTGKFINKDSGSSAEELFKGNFAASPDKNKLAFLQNENGILQINMVDLKNFKLSKLVIDSQFREQPESRIELFWLDDGKLVLHSSSKGWLIDLRKDIHICSWEEADSGRLLGLLGK